MVESLSLTQEGVGSSPAIFLKNFFLSLNSANSVKTFRENSNVPRNSVVSMNRCQPYVGITT